MTQIPAPTFKRAPAPERLKLKDMVTPIFDAEMGSRLALMRMKRLWKQKELSEKLGLNPHTLGMLELGKITTARHPFTVTRLEETFGPRATDFILMKLHASEFEPWGISHKYNKHLMKTRKPREKGEHWTHRRLRAGLKVRGTFQNVADEAWDQAFRILEQSEKRHTNSIKRKG